MQFVLAFGFETVFFLFISLFCFPANQTKRRKKKAGEKTLIVKTLKSMNCKANDQMILITSRKNKGKKE